MKIPLNRLRGILGWTSVAALLVFPIFSLSGAVDMFLKLEGKYDFKGESTDKSHPDEINVLAWNWGATNSGNTHVGGGGGSGKSSVKDISVTKYIDRSSPALLLSAMNGNRLTKGTLTVRKAGEKPLEYLKIEFKDIIVTSVSTGGGDGEDRLTENVSFNFAKYKLTYTPQDSKGGAGTPVEVMWDITANKESF